MFEPLADFIRLRRRQRNLTQEGLAKLAGVSRRALAELEDGQNVTLLSLTKVAKALELTELPIGDLRLRASQPELTPLVRAADTLARLEPTLSAWATAAQQIRDATGSLDELIGESFASGPSARDIVDAAEHLAKIPATERNAAGDTLRSLGVREPRPRASRPKSSAGSAARRRTR